MLHFKRIKALRESENYCVQRDDFVFLFLFGHNDRYSKFCWETLQVE